MNPGPINKCELCGGPLDEDQVSHEESYCRACTEPDGSIFEILNYFLIPIQRPPLTCDDKVVDWPHPKDPALWHKQACTFFPGWHDIVESFKELHNLKYFDLSSIDIFLSYLRAHGKTDEEICIMKRSEVIALINHDLSARAMRSLSPATPLFLGHKDALHHLQA